MSKYHSKSARLRPQSGLAELYSTCICFEIVLISLKSATPSFGSLDAFTVSNFFPCIKCRIEEKDTKRKREGGEAEGSKKTRKQAWCQRLHMLNRDVPLIRIKDNRFLLWNQHNPKLKEGRKKKKNGRIHFIKKKILPKEEREKEL